MNEIQILKRNPRKVLESLKLGVVESIELAADQITDDFMIYGLRGGLIDELSSSFPDPRREEEITTKQILSASIAGHFQDMYAISLSSRKWGSVTLCSTFTSASCGTGFECEGVITRGRYIKTGNQGECTIQWRCNPQDAEWCATPGVDRLV